MECRSLEPGQNDIAAGIAQLEQSVRVQSESGSAVIPSIAGKCLLRTGRCFAAATVMVALFLILPGCCRPCVVACDFSTACRQYQRAVGVLTTTLVDGDGKPFSYETDNIKISPVTAIATVFAIAPGEFVTNAHVLYALREEKGEQGKIIATSILDSENEVAAVAAQIDVDEYCGKNNDKIESRRMELMEKYKDVHIGAVEIRMSHGARQCLPVRAFRLHPDYTENVDSDRELFLKSAFDCAIIYADGAAEQWFPLADKTTLYTLGAGTAVGSLGFPMEGLAEDGGLNLDSPEATFKDGTIGKVTRTDNAFGAPEENRLVCHSIPQVAGSSGAPVFLLDGRVVAIVWGASCIEQGNGEEEEDVLSFSNPAQQNFALRIDAIGETRDAEIKYIKEWLH